jgi:membrane protease YdiL (CAAX protease family)
VEDVEGVSGAMAVDPWSPLLPLLGAHLFPAWSFYAAPWLLGTVTAFVARATGRRWHQAVGLGIMTVPVWDTLWGIIESFGPLLQGGFVLRAYTRHELSSLYVSKFLSELGYLGAGFLIYASDTWRAFWSPSPRRIARALVDAGLPMGALVPWMRQRGLAARRWGEGISALVGLAGFPLLLFGTLLFSLATANASALRQSDETSVFANMTIYHAIVISLAAGFGEELVFRGLVQTAIQRILPRGGLAWPMLVAVVVQSVFFGLAHSGYGTWIHVLEPALFGLIAGLVAWAFGIWAAIVLHVLVDVLAFGIEASRHNAWVLPALNDFLISDILLLLGVAVWAAIHLARRVAQRRSPAPPTN